MKLKHLVLALIAVATFAWSQTSTPAGVILPGPGVVVVGSTQWISLTSGDVLNNNGDAPPTTGGPTVPLYIVMDYLTPATANYKITVTVEGTTETVVINSSNARPIGTPIYSGSFPVTNWPQGVYTQTIRARSGLGLAPQ